MSIGLGAQTAQTPDAALVAQPITPAPSATPHANGTANGPTPTPNKPLALIVQPENIPDVLKQRSNWVLWLLEYRPDQKKPWTKVPYQPNGHKADATKSQTWNDFPTVLARYERGGFDGIGFALTEDSGIVGVDIDDAQTQTGEWIPEVCKAFASIDSYAEISPSGRGVRFFARGTLPPKGRKKGRFEVYSNARYLTVTGHKIEECDGEINERTEELAAFHARHIAPPAPETKTENPQIQKGTLSENELFERATKAKNGAKFSALWSGDNSGGQSEGDLALCSMLAFWTGKDAARMDAMFRSSSRLREKWDERHSSDGQTYGQMTIEKAISLCGEVFGQSKGPNQNPPMSADGKPASEPFDFKFSTDNDLDACLSDISWLWPGYIPNGFPTMVISEQDMGKSTVAQDLARTLIDGGRWPDGQEVAPISPDQKLLWIDTEGTLALFRQRLKDWGMARGRFIFPPDPLKELRLDNALDWQWIEAAVEHFSPPLIVIDALSGSHQGEENNNDIMKMILKRVNELTQRRKIAAVIIHHLNKAPFGVPEYPITLGRVRGAGSITQFCRSVLALGVPDKSNPESRRLDVIKMNLARKPEPIGYSLTGNGPVWGDAPEVPQPRRAADEAGDFLLDILANGLVPSDDVFAEAKAKNIGVNSLKAAKKALKIKAHREGGKDGRWFWALPNYDVSKGVI